jgi:hypothetical protein
MRFSLVAFAAILAAAATSAEAAPCEPSDVTGLYSGTATESDGEKSDVTLNLFCDKGGYAAQMFTSNGDFAVTDASGAGGHVVLKIDTRAALASADLMLHGDALSGTFEVAGDKGTMALTRTGAALVADAMVPRLDLTPAEWRADLKFYAEQLPKRHASAFFYLPREKFEAEIAALDAQLDRMNGDEVFVALQQITKSIGDGHTGLVAPADRRVMPLTFAKFGDDIRVVAVGPGLDAALGARLLEVGGVAAHDVWQRVMTLTPAGELDELRREDALVYLARGYALHGLGVIGDRNHAVYTFADDSGRSFDIDVKALAPDEHVTMKSGYADTALEFQNKDAPMWCKALPEAHAVYCGWRAYEDLATHAKEMFALVDRTKSQKLIIDMRDNGGGDNTVGYAEIVKPLKARSDLNRKGHLFVLIGPETFSAAMNNAAQFQDETNAILVGETIGEKPNSYQEPRQFRLPNSHLVVRASTLYYEFRKHGENAVRPNKEIIPSWNDVKSGRDPVLEWALAQ